MNVVVFHDGSALGKRIVDTWHKQPSGTKRILLTPNTTLEDLERHRPDLVVLASDMPSDFEEQVLHTCRAARLNILAVLGRGTVVLIGPLETPQTAGCTTCLQLRWENTVERSLLCAFLNLQVDDAEDALLLPLEVASSELTTLADIVLEEIHRILLHAPDPPNSHGKVGVFDTDEEEGIEWVPLIPSHDCPRCNLVPDDNPSLAKVQFASHPVEDMEALRVGAVDRHRLEKQYVHTKVGYISSLNGFWDGGRYAQAEAHIYTPRGDEIAGYGSGVSMTDAKRSAMLEVLERSCGFRAVNRRPVVFGRHLEFKDKAMHPSIFGLQSPELFQSTELMEPFDEEKRYSWVWVYSTRQNQPILIPEQIAYYGRTADDKRFITETSNGCALGASVGEAVLHGIFEVLERDGFLNMWYAKLSVPELRLGNRCPPQVLDMFKHLETIGFQVRLFNISHDMGIPAVCAVAIHEAEGYPKVVSGSACHLHPYQAVHGALRELTVQTLNLQRHADGRRESAVAMLADATNIKDILDHVAVAALPEAYGRWEFLLRRAEGESMKTVEDAYSDTVGLYQIDSHDMRLILCSVLDDLHSRGFDVIVVNQTSAELSYGGLHVAKVLIPGMTPITFGYGFQRIRGLTRILELPVRMGYSERVLTEQELNHDCHPLS